MRRISMETKEEFFNSRSCPSSATLEGREGQVWERTKPWLTLGELQTLRGCAVVLEHCSVGSCVRITWVLFRINRSAQAY